MVALAGQVAVVAGATRGAGRGIAVGLGEAGAIVYCTGRSSRSAPREHQHVYAHRPETIEDTAEQVDAAGGTGISVRVDHADGAQVRALFERIEREQGRLDVLANVLTFSPVPNWTPMWTQDVDSGRVQVDGWIWPHIRTAHAALPLMLRQQSGLMVEVIEQEGIGYHGQIWFDLYMTVLKRLMYAVAIEGADHGITALSLTPGFMRTEAMLDHYGATAGTWREIAMTNRAAKAAGFIASETPLYVGRAIAALAADPDRARFSGGVYSTSTLSEIYDFTDADGTRPNMNRYFAEHHPDLFRPRAGVRHWTLSNDQ